MPVRLCVGDCVLVRTPSPIVNAGELVPNEINEGIGLMLRLRSPPS